MDGEPSHSELHSAGSLRTAVDVLFDHSTGRIVIAQKEDDDRPADIFEEPSDLAFHAGASKAV